MKKYSIHLAFLFSLIFLSVGCDHDTEVFDGPSLIDRFGPFNVTTDFAASRNTVDFGAGQTGFFTAEFNKNVQWVITITGQSSGAVKRIEGFDKSINIDNAIWVGGTTDLPLFGIEMCDVVLTVPEEPSFEGNAMVEIISPRDYASLGKVITDFETDLGANLFFGNFQFELNNQTGRRDAMPAPAEGGFYYYMQGTDNVVPNDFFVGLVSINPQVNGETYVSVPTTVPEELYFNCFLYSDAGPHGIGIIQFAYDQNDNGTFDDGTDPIFTTGDIDLGAWEGWRLESYPMSETGISQEQLEKIIAVRLVLISNANTQPSPPLPVDFGTDFMIFTQGGPLEL